MKIMISKEEKQLLEAEGIALNEDKDYTEDEALSLLDEIYDAEIMYSNFPDEDARSQKKAESFAHLADKIQQAIPDN